MLISYGEIKAILDANSIEVTGALHVGAHNCEELPFQNRLGLRNEDVVWIDAIPQKVNEATQRGIPNVYHGVITDRDNDEITFHISNNGQSSSIFDFGTHSREYPGIVQVDSLHLKTTTLDTLIQSQNVDSTHLNFWNFDIQGAELLALKGAPSAIHYAKALYLEVNEKPLYKGCALIGEIDSFLKGHNFKRVLTHMTRAGWGDALQIRSH